MRSVLLALACAMALSACELMKDPDVMAELTSAEIQQRIDRPRELPINVVVFDVPLSFEEAYTRFQRGARRCWQFPNGVLEDSGLRHDLGRARLARRINEYIFVVATIRPGASGTSTVDVRTFYSPAYLEHLRSWLVDGSEYLCEASVPPPGPDGQPRQP